MSCKDQQAAYKEAENALAGAVLERQQASDDLAAAQAALAEAQAEADAANAAYDATIENVQVKATEASAAHADWMTCLTGGITDPPPEVNPLRR